MASCQVPDLYKGKIGVDKEEAHHVRSVHSLDYCLARTTDTVRH